MKSIACLSIVFFLLLSKVLFCTPSNTSLKNPTNKPKNLEGKSGQNIGNLQLVDLQGTIISTTDLVNSKVTGFFILSPKCPLCDPNIYFFDKIARLRDGNFLAYGVILADENMLRKFLKLKKIRFNVYRPLDAEKFKNAFNIKHSLSQTTFFRNGKVIFNKVGELSSEEYFKIKKILKGGFK